MPAELTVGELVAIVSLAQAAAGFVGTWAALKWRLSNVERETVRAHKRLDAIDAPNVTLEL